MAEIFRLDTRGQRALDRLDWPWSICPPCQLPLLVCAAAHESTIHKRDGSFIVKCPLPLNLTCTPRRSHFVDSVAYDCGSLKNHLVYLPYLECIATASESSCNMLCSSQVIRRFVGLLGLINRPPPCFDTPNRNLYAMEQDARYSQAVRWEWPRTALSTRYYGALLPLPLTLDGAPSTHSPLKTSRPVTPELPYSSVVPGRPPSTPRGLEDGLGYASPGLAVSEPDNASELPSFSRDVDFGPSVLTRT
ncbi:hypothetical protein B0H13DRAFT_2345674 [Mycena leptocephala]|nr:hypothetical protein B0H13DRAFT_2345674 [Mycena leptocephala]